MVEQTFWDEMTGGGADVRTVYGRVDEWLRNTPPDAARPAPAPFVAHERQ